VGHTYNRARELCQQVGEASQLFRVLYGRRISWGPTLCWEQSGISWESILLHANIWNRASLSTIPSSTTLIPSFSDGTWGYFAEPGRPIPWGIWAIPTKLWR
jgi:hypothetical protein